MNEEQQMGRIRKIINDTYFKTFVICVFLIVIFHFLNLFTWYFSFIVTLFCSVVMLVYPSFNLPKQELNLIKLIIYFLIVVCVGGYTTYHRTTEAYNTSEKIYEELKFKNDIHVFYNDAAKAFILFVEEEEKETLVLDFSNLKDYTTVKKEFLDGEILVQKKRVKLWFESEPSIVYYLKGFKFKE